MRVKSHYDYTDEELETIFASFRLKPLMFTHEAHLRLAYVHISKYEPEQAAQNMCEQIKGYAESLSVPEKFNMTVTIASIKAMHHFMSKAKSDNFKGLTQEFPQLLTDFREIIAQHYSFNVFADLQAKQEYVAPDLLPF
ncbi:MAG: hypothetical protein RIF33_08665 [Cyclobacteriaceae bacterium]